jgi:hypothetical protein
MPTGQCRVLDPDGVGNPVRQAPEARAKDHGNPGPTIAESGPDRGCALADSLG